MRRWQHLPPEADFEQAAACYRPDIYRRAAATLGESLPDHDESDAMTGPPMA